MNAINSDLRNLTSAAGFKDNNANKKMDDLASGKILGATKSSAEPKLSQIAEDFTNFIQLLTTQLKYQSPDDPFDTKDMSQQIALMTQVEQSVVSNQHLKHIDSKLQANQASEAAQLIGKEVDYSALQGELKNNSSLQFSYKFSKEDEDKIDKAKIRILNAKGSVVFETESTVSKGVNDFRWNGKNTSGKDCPEGMYKIDVSAEDSYGKSIYIDKNPLRGTVEAAQPGNDNTYLIVDGKKVQINQISLIKGNSPSLGIDEVEVDVMSHAEELKKYNNNMANLHQQTENLVDQRV